MELITLLYHHIFCGKKNPVWLNIFHAMDIWSVFFISRQLLLIYWIYIRFYPEEFLVNFHILFHCLCYTISSEIISNVLLLYSLEPLQIRYFKIKITTSTYESKLSNRCRFTLPAFSSALFIYRKMINNPLSLVESCFIGWLIHVVSLLD